MFIELRDAPGLIVGGGMVAKRKIDKLLPYGPELTVVSPEIKEEIRAIPGLTLYCRAFQPEDLDGAAFVIAATDRREENARISQLCRQKRIPVNVVDDKELCSFLFPALVKRGELSIGISTGGCSPTAAIAVKERIDATLPRDFDGMLTFLHRQRERIRAAVEEEALRGAVLRQLYDAAVTAGRPLTDEEADTVLVRVTGGVR